MNYRFFDYKDFIQYDGSDFLGLAHIIYIVIAVAAIVLLCVFLRKAKKENVEKYLKIIAIIVPVLEVCKIAWESYWDISLGKGFNWGGLLPLYTCSIFIYILPVAAFTKGKVKESALCFLTTIAIFAGLTNFFVPPILHGYPFFTYATFTSLYFHFLMVFTGLFIVSTGYYVPKFNVKTIVMSMIPLVCFSLIVIPANFLIEALKPGSYPDYMLYMHGNGAPLLPQISEFFRGINCTLLFSIFVMICYTLFPIIFIGIYTIISKIKHFFKNKKLQRN